MPPVHAAAFLITVLDGAGWSAGGGMALSPLLPSELLAWCALTHTELGPIDVQDVLDASRVYVGSIAEYDGVPCPGPYIPKLTPEEEEALAAQEKLEFEKKMGIAPKAGA